MRHRYDSRTKTWVDITDWRPRRAPGPYIMTDSMAPCVHPATGEVLDSKSAFRAITRANGLVEMGNDAPRTVAPPPMDDAKADIAQAIEMLEQGYQPPPSEVMEGDYKMVLA